MCSYIVEKAALVGSAKGRKGWMKIDTANVYFDHPYHSTLDHVLAIDFTSEDLFSSRMMSMHSSTHSSQMKTVGPAMSLRTSCWLLPQNEQ